MQLHEKLVVSPLTYWKRLSDLGLRQHMGIVLSPSDQGVVMKG